MSLCMIIYIICHLLLTRTCFYLYFIYLCAVVNYISRTQLTWIRANNYGANNEQFLRVKIEANNSRYMHVYSVGEEGGGEWILS